MYNKIRSTPPLSKIPLAAQAAARKISTSRLASINNPDIQVPVRITMATESKPHQEIGPQPSVVKEKSSSSYFYNATTALGHWLGFGNGNIQSYRGKTALVTGASSGIGAAFAEALAERGANLILTSHPKDKGELSDVAQKLEREFGVDVETLVADLSETGGAQFINNQVHPDERTIDVLINNAGFATYGPFNQEPIESIIAQIQCNVISAVRLTHAILPSMRSRGAGEIVHTAAVGAFFPMPFCATYCATKAFLLHFSEALWAENRDYGVQILALCPGPTHTNITRNSNFRLEPLGRMENAKKVVAAAITALAQGRSQVHSTTIGALKVFLASFLPRHIVLGMLLETLKKCAVDVDSKQIIEGNSGSGSFMQRSLPEDHTVGK
jgi:uncharacterized protein